MADRDISKADYGNYKGTAQDYSVSPETTDGPMEQGEVYYDNPDWRQYFGYYRNIPELQIAIDAKSIWSIGMGYISNPITELKLSTIKGFGKDSFNTILENIHRVAQINGDSYSEIIRDEKGNLLNLKPLDPGSIRVVANTKGLIIRYEQFMKGKARTKGSGRSFKPEEIFHYCRNRTADEIHGTSLIKSVESLLLMYSEAQADYRKLLHRNLYPVKVIEVDTDDTSEIADFKVKADKAFTQGENLYIPKGTVGMPQILGTPPNATLNPLPWIRELKQDFFKACGVPQIIVGGGQDVTEAAVKIAYLAFENVIKSEQLSMKEEVLSQLNLEIDFELPASLQNELISDQSKSETMQAATPEDTSAQPEQPQQQAAAPVQ